MVRESGSRPTAAEAEEAGGAEGTDGAEGAEGTVTTSLRNAAAEADRLRSRASTLLRVAVGEAAEAGLSQRQIAGAIGRSQPEVSRLVRSYRNRFRPSSRLGRIVAAHRDEIIARARAHHATGVRVFGSVARGTDDESSDIDLLVTLDRGADLFDLAALDLELAELLAVDREAR